MHGRVVDEVAICLPWADWSMVEPVTRVCEAEGRVVRIPMRESALPLEGGIVETFDGQNVVSFVTGPDRALGLLTKRMLDFALSGVLLVVLAPVLVLVAIRIRAVDGTPVIFRQHRVGLHGREFTLLKFRTMVPDAELLRPALIDSNEIIGGAFKVTADPRLTRTGRFLRSTSLDELPQLWNVLRGEMSLVGPRPPLPDEVAQYDLWHRRRLSMKPGMTGLWQVEARRSSSFDQWVRFDLEYIDDWSLLLDLRILLRTVPALFSGEGR
jgi:exopolysaccharide biosynthesis polyprenyl glycosylphosphotransferase